MRRPRKKRGSEYEELEAKLTEKLLAPLYLPYPQGKGRVDPTELSTPLSSTTFTSHPRAATGGAPS